jgi:alpha-beta hydrolase superfamily lysophospholipase
MERDTLTMRDGTTLVRRRWPAATVKARGTIVLVHGIGEHGGRYAHVAARLTAEGWGVVAVDHRGHGESGGARGELAANDDLLTDLAAVVDAERYRRPSALLLLGHSMGGLIAARFVAGAVRPVDGLILSSPALATRMTTVQRLLLAVGRRLFPDLAIGNGLNPQFVSHDRAEVAAYIADPLVHDRVSARLAAFIADGGTYVRERTTTWRVPTLLLYAGDDRYVDPDGSAAFLAAAPSDVVTGQCFPTLYHELFNEVERDAVLDVVSRWLREQAYRTD